MSELHVLDHYNYPSMNRRDLMSLSKISSRDEKIHNVKNRINTNRDYSQNLMTADISGLKRSGDFSNKISYGYTNSDIPLSSPKTKFDHVPLKPNYAYSIKDIEGTSPSSVAFKTSRQASNPLNPKYKLQSYTEIEPEIPKFIRNNIDCSDIEGAKPNKRFNWQTRDNINYNDIEPKRLKNRVNCHLNRHRDIQYSSLDYSDVTNCGFKSSRKTNPLDPTYLLSNKEGEKYTIGKIDYSYPTTDYQYRYPEPYNLKTDDIFGAAPGTKNYYKKFNSENTNLKNDDIVGSNSGSLHKGIVTKRSTNPLDPNYRMLSEEINNPYGNTLFSKGSKKIIDLESKVQENGLQIIGSNYTMEKKFDNTEPNKIYNNRYETNDNYQFTNIKDSSMINNPSLRENVNVNSSGETNFGIMHDKYLISAHLNPMKSRLSPSNKSILNPETNKNRFTNKNPVISKSSNLNFSLTNAQKLDKYINNS